MHEICKCPCISQYNEKKTRLYFDDFCHLQIDWWAIFFYLKTKRFNSLKISKVYSNHFVPFFTFCLIFQYTQGRTGHFPLEGGGTEDAISPNFWICPDFGPIAGVHSMSDPRCKLIPQFLTIQKLPEFSGKLPDFWGGCCPFLPPPLPSTLYAYAITPLSSQSRGGII